MTADELRQMRSELEHYYGCPKQLIDEAIAYLEMGGRDPAEVVEELVRLEEEK